MEQHRLSIEEKKREDASSLGNEAFAKLNEKELYTLAKTMIHEASKKHQAHKYLPKADLEELENILLEQLLRMRSETTPYTSAQRKNYINTRASGLVLDKLREYSQHSRRQLMTEKRLAAAREILRNKSIQDSDEAMAKELGVDVKRYRAMTSYIHKPRAHAKYMKSEGDPENTIDENQKPTLEDGVFLKEGDEILKNTLQKGFTKQERNAALLTLQGYTPREIAAVLELSESRISQLLKAVLEKAKARISKI